MLTLPTPLLVFAAILLFPVVLVGSILVDAFELEVEEQPAR
ncbi:MULTISPECIES: hypothetical protein [Myxococcus]|nr:MULTISPECIES: hypothetical protein [Myxococcus]